MHFSDVFKVVASENDRVETVYSEIQSQNNSEKMNFHETTI